MRRYQLSGLEHIHMMRHVPRSYDMTRTHIMHKGVNKHVDVVLRCSPKNWKKKKVAVSVVKGEKKNDAARIRANAKKGYVAVRKNVNEQFEADRRIAASAYETNFGTFGKNSDSLIHDMKSQISSMARKSADYIEDQLTARPEKNIVGEVIPNAEINSAPVENENPLISAETEEILKKGGYRLPNSNPAPENPYTADYIMNASNEEFHNLMNSLEKSLDEACKKYSVGPVAPETKAEQEIQPQTSTEPEYKNESENNDAGYNSYNSYSGYNGGYSMPGGISLSVTKKQEITEDQENEQGENNEFKPALSFTNGGEHYNYDIREDDLFGRKLNRPGEGYVPPAYFFDDDDTTPDTDSEDDTSEYVPLPEPEPVPVPPASQKQAIFFTEEDNEPLDQTEEGYPREDYVQQQIFLPSHTDNEPPEHLYNQPEEEEEFAEPTLFHDSGNEDYAAQDDGRYEPPMVFPDTDENDVQPAEPAANDGNDEAPVSQMIFPDEGDEDMPPPMIFPDKDEEDMPPPMIFPDEDEEEGYSPAPVSPDRNEINDINDFYGGGNESNGVIDRSGHTLFSRTGDQIRKVIGVIRGPADTDTGADNGGEAVRNHNIEITYSDRDN